MQQDDVAGAGTRSAARDRAGARRRSPVVAGDRPHDGDVAVGAHHAQRAGAPVAIGRAHQLSAVDSGETRPRGLHRRPRPRQLVAKRSRAAPRQVRVRVGVIAEGVTAGGHLTHQPRLALGEGADHEEGRPRAVAGEQLEERLGRADVRAVVERERDHPGGSSRAADRAPVEL